MQLYESLEGAPVFTRWVCVVVAPPMATISIWKVCAGSQISCLRDFLPLFLIERFRFCEIPGPSLLAWGPPTDFQWCLEQKTAGHSKKHKFKPVAQPGLVGVFIGYLTVCKSHPPSHLHLCPPNTPLAFDTVLSDPHQSTGPVPKMHQACQDVLL